jgi:hypothetical protein
LSFNVYSRNGGHVNPPLFHDYQDLKSDFGTESAKRIIRFRCAHLSTMREAIQGIDALEHSQIRDVEKLDVYFDRDAFDQHVRALEVWKADMPEEAASSRVFEGSEAAKVLRFQPFSYCANSRYRCSNFPKWWSASSPLQEVPFTHIVP